jgi:multidrug efflux pump subunit AcrA (membrane-fusion protein)
MHKIGLYIIFLIAAGFYTGCKSKTTSEEEPAKSESDVQTPVTVIDVARDTLRQYAELNATSTYLQSNIVKAPSNGYIKSVNISPGQFIAAGKILFSLQTKEAKNIGTVINNLDTSFRFSGLTEIKASQTGYINQLNHQVGDYVQDGEQLAAISTENSFGFVLNVPYEMRRFVTLHKQVEVDLPDGTKLNGVVGMIMPAVDSVSQTQRVLVRVNSSVTIPENLVAKVKVLKTQKYNVIAIPKEAILSDESQNTFWVMKMLDSSTAVKVPVTKGLEANGKIEITAPEFKPGDQLLISGNYGLGDTARVKIMKPE